MTWRTWSSRPSREKFDAVVEEIQERQKTTGQPILVGTISIETSEMLSKKLKKNGDQAQGPQREEARARKRRSSLRPAARNQVTISTNMAGRGTDIVLGGNPEFHGAGEKCGHDKDHPEFPDLAR